MKRGVAEDDFEVYQFETEILPFSLSVVTETLEGDAEVVGRSWGYSFDHVAVH